MQCLYPAQAVRPYIRNPTLALDTDSRALALHKIVQVQLTTLRLFIWGELNEHGSMLCLNADRFGVDERGCCS